MKNPEVQEKINNEIDNALFWSDDKVLSFDMVEKMKYLDCCVEETCRKYPVIPVISRIASKDFKIDEKLLIPEGTSVLIPVLGFHRDPDIYENPMKFQPERFLNSANGNGKSTGVFHLSFGAGPRNCNSIKLGKTIIKIGIVQILSKFLLSFSDPDMMNGELKFHPNQVILTPVKKFQIKLTER